MTPHQRERHPYPWYQARPPYLAPGEQQAENAASVRAWIAMLLATTPETWAGHILTLPVTPDAVE